MGSFAYLIALLLVIINCSYECEEPIINTKLGKIIGHTIFFDNIPVLAFQGIPFVKPPVGNLRFKKPVPVEAWNQVVYATKYPPACIQHSSNPFPWYDDFPGHSEDCLYLNIWTPYNATPLNKKTIMFFVHGGGFRISSNRLDYYDGRVLAALGDVIVVNTNYRLGPMGFLYSGTEDAPGNMGLYDILEALKWVHSNIEDFGGDKSSITLFGQSAGAIAIGMFMTSPLFKGLFVRAIMQSGSAANLDGEFNAIDYELSQALAKGVGCATDDKSLQNDPKNIMDCLRGIDGLNLTLTLGKVNKNPQRGFYPRFGDEILPHNARKAFINENFMDIEVLMGTNNNEGSTLVTKAYKNVFGFFGHKDPQINKTFGEKILKNYFKNFPDLNTIIKHYLKDIDEENYDEIIFQVQAAEGEYARICPSVYLAEKVSEKSKGAYFYLFNHRPSRSPWAPWMGVVHFEETPFIFGYPLRYRQQYIVSEWELSRHMIDVWTNFAKTGIPSSDHRPLYTKNDHLQRVFQLDGSVIEIGPHLKNCDLFRKYFGF